MFRRLTKKQLLIRRIITYVVMILAVIVIVAGTILFILGYRLDSQKGRLEQGALVQLEPFALDAAEHHCAKSSIADGQGLHPLRRGPAIPEQRADRRLRLHFLRAERRVSSHDDRACQRRRVEDKVAPRKAVEFGHGPRLATVA